MPSATRADVERPPAAAGWCSIPPTSWQRRVTLVTAALLAGLLFARLGHYALWDDEANTALIARGVWRTGDTSAVVGQNIVAYRDAAELKGTRVRYLPPLQYYLAAPFVGPFPGRAAVARLPFALTGLAALLLSFAFLRRANADRLTWSLVALALVGAIPFVLFARQCRYYPVAALASVAVAYLYLWRRSGPWRAAALGLASLCVLAASYLAFVPLVACLLVDYLLWGRRERAVSWREVAAWALPLLVLGLPLVLVWNPLGKSVVQPQGTSWLVDRLTLLWWSVRELARGELACSALIVLSLPLAVAGDLWLRRALAALAVYLLALCAVSPQPVALTTVADVRYLVPVMPLCLAIAVLTLRGLARRLDPRIVLAVGVVAFHSNLLHGSWLFGAPPRSTTLAFAGELVWPLPDPYGAAAAFVRGHLPPGTTVATSPDYATYPLMFHAPDARYAWQLTEAQAPRYPGLPDFHFGGRVAPDCIVAFGPSVRGFGAGLKLRDGTVARYRMQASLAVDWRPVQRPELFWRRFDEHPPPALDQGQGVYVLRLSRP